MRDHIAYETADVRVAALLAAAAAPAEAPVPGEAEALAAFRRATGSPEHHSRRHMKSRTAAKLVTATALSAMSLVGAGYAVAATDTLPGAAAEAAFDAVGVTVHGKSADAHGASDGHGKSAEAKARAAERKAAGGEVSTASNDHGVLVSTFAKETTLTGRAKGQAIAAIASAKRQDGAASKRQDGAAPEGKRQDGAHSSTQRGTAGDRVDDTDDQGATSSATGRATATTKSGGASGAGAGNADTARP